MKLDLVVAGAQQALSDKRKARGWLDDFIRQLTPSDIKGAIEKNTHNWISAVDEFHLYSPTMYPFASIILKTFYDELEAHLTHPTKIYKILSKAPNDGGLLKTPVAINYITNDSEFSYDWIRGYLWPNTIKIKGAHYVRDQTGSEGWLVTCRCGTAYFLPIYVPQQDKPSEMVMVAIDPRCPTCNAWPEMT